MTTLKPLASLRPVPTTQPTALANGLLWNYDQVDEAHRREVSAAAMEINAHRRRVGESTLRIGQKLIAVKALLPHGQFEDWCATEFDYSKSTVEGIMRIYDKFKDKPQVFDLFSFSALRQLSGPSVSDEERRTVLKIAKKTVKTEGKMGKKIVDKIIQDSRKSDDLHEKSVLDTLLNAEPVDGVWTVVEEPEVEQLRRENKRLKERVAELEEIIRDMERMK